MAKKYSCKVCGAELYFDPGRGKMHCDYCESDFDPAEYDFVPGEEEGQDETIAQGVDEETGAASAAAGVQQATDDSVSTDDLVVYKCPNCGAEVITSNKTVATTCVYCNRAITLTGNVGGQFRPDYVLPFEKTREDVERAYKELCRKSFLTPRLFTREATIKKIKGMYIPYWLYSFKGTVALDVYGEKVHIHRHGDDEITETASYNVQEEAEGRFNRIPADAMKEMDNLMMDSLEPFDFNKLQKFNPAYLSGFYTQQWDETSSDNEPRAKARAKESLSGSAMRHSGSFTSTRIKSEHYDWSEQKVEQAMLPVWMMYTEYKGKNYIFGMNGQTGKILGEIPQDPMRLLEIGGGIFILSQIIMMIIRILGVL